MKKLLLILGLISTFTGVSINKQEILDLFNSTEYSPIAKEAAAKEVANQLENQYNKLLNGKAPFGKHFCNN